MARVHGTGGSSRLAAVLVLATLINPTRGDSQTPMLVPAPGSPVAVGAGSGEVFLVDLNRDGHVDLLTKHLLSQRVSVRLGDGAGRFTASADCSTSFAFQPGTIALGDVDNDGIVDLAVASRDSVAEYVRIYRGTGTGGFVLASGPHRAAAAVRTYKPVLRFADVDTDGNLDVVTADGRRNTVEVLLGDGSGGLAAARSVTIDADYDRYWFDVGDVDGDGRVDLVTLSSADPAHGPNRVTVRHGIGTGDFDDRPGASISLAGVPRAVTLAHLNDDAHADIVVAHGSGLLTVLLNTGRGEFVVAAASPHDIGAEAYAVAVADVNGDGRRDLIAATVNSLTVLLANDRGFVRAHGSPFRAGPGAYNLAVADVNGDGTPDVAASSFEGAGVTVLLGR